MVSGCVERLGGTQPIVVDNASGHGTAAAVAAAFPEVRAISLESRTSLAAAYNRGAEAGSGDLVLFLNDDIFAESGAIDRLVNALRGDPGAVAAAGRLIDPETGVTQHEYEPRPFPGLGRFLIAFSGLSGTRAAERWTGPHRDRPLDGDPVAVDQPAGACLLVRRSELEAVGGWDEAFELWFEDVDLARRLSERGRILYVPAAEFRHVGGRSTGRLRQSDVIRLSYGSALRYGEKHFGRARRVALGLLFGSAAAARTVLSRGDPQLAAAYRDVRRRATRLMRPRRAS